MRITESQLRKIVRTLVREAADPTSGETVAASSKGQYAKVNPAVLDAFEKELLVGSDMKTGDYTKQFQEMTPKGAAELVDEFLSKQGVSELSYVELGANRDVAYKAIIDKLGGKKAVKEYDGGLPGFVNMARGVVGAAVAGRFTRDPRYEQYVEKLGFDLSKFKQQAGIK